MKKISILLIMIFVVIKLNFALDFNDMSDDFLLVKVGEYDITVSDFQMYIMGYNSISNWDLASVESILNIMIMDMLFLNGCNDENITVAENEVMLYGDYFFQERSIDFNNLDSIQVYFDMNDPYYNIEDFFMKSTYNLMKIKYLSNKGYVDSVNSMMIFFSTEGLKKIEKQKLKEKATQIANSIFYGETLFDDCVKKYSDDTVSKNNGGKIGEINQKSRFKKIFKKPDFEKIFKTGLFFPIFLEGKNGYYIIMNYEYNIKDEQKSTVEIINKLSEKYKVIKMVSFSDKKS